MKTITTANPVHTIASIWVHGSYITQAMGLLSNITKDSFENRTAIQKFDIGTDKSCPALLYQTGSYESELEEFKKAYGHQLPLIDLEYVEINKRTYIAVTLKEEKKETIKELDDSSFNVRAFLHIGYATAPDYYASVVKSNKANLSNRLPGAYQPLNHPSFLEGKDFWLISNYAVGPEVLQRFIDNIKDQVPFNLEVVKINSFYYIAMTEKEQPKEEEVKEEPKTEVVVQPGTVCPHQFISVDSLESGYIANERATLTDILAVTKETVEDVNNTYDPDDEVRIYQLIGTVKRIVKIEENVTAIKTNHPTEQPKTNGIDYADPNQQYAGGF